MRRAFGGLVGALFALTAALQLNDPDPALWALYYASVATLGGLALARRDPRWLGAALALAGGAWALTLAPSVVTWLREHAVGEIVTGMSPDRPYIEEARECLGLCMAAASAAALALWRPPPPAPEAG